MAALQSIEEPGVRCYRLEISHFRPFSNMDDSNSDAVDDESKTCKLIGGTFQSFLQLVLAIAALAALIVKRWREYPRRRPKIWIYDVSKQAVGGITMHAWNILFGELIKFAFAICFMTYMPP